MFAATVKNVNLIISHVKWGLDFLLNQTLLSSPSCTAPHLLQIIDAHTDKQTSACASTVECAVCLCRVGNGEEIRQLKCSHVFHRVCLDRWIGQGRWTCPLCRNHLKNSPRSGSGEKRREILVFGFAEVSLSEDKDSWWLRWSEGVRELVCFIKFLSMYLFLFFLYMESMKRFFWIHCNKVFFFCLNYKIQNLWCIQTIYSHVFIQIIFHQSKFWNTLKTMREREREKWNKHSHWENMYLKTSIIWHVASKPIRQHFVEASLNSALETKDCNKPQ